MTGPTARRRLARLAASALLAAGALWAPARGAVAAIPANPPAAATVEAASLPRWTGGIDLFRAGVFTTQATWTWCTAAGVQISRNIAFHEADHSRASQQRYFDYMRAHDHYPIPLSDGTDPAGWAAGLRRYVDGRYEVVASASFDSALRSAVTNLRLTNLPVSLAVQHGNHAWLLTGFTATADPAVTSRFTVTSVRVVGPLWGLQSRAYGYDMRPDTKLTPRQLAGFFTTWHYARIRMSFEGDWVSIQPVAKARASAAPSAPSAAPSALPAATASPVPAPSQVAPSESPEPSIASPVVPSASPEPSIAASAATADSPATFGPAGPLELDAAPVARVGVLAIVPVAGLALAAAVVAVLAMALRPRRWFRPWLPGRRARRLRWRRWRRRW